jgi:phosphoenolpyruvate synthase/pyruvate phosphate dikinase
MKQVKEAINKFKDIKKKIDDIKESQLKMASQQKDLLDELKTTPEEKLIFDTARTFMEMKNYRMLVRHQVHYNCDRIFTELSKRKSLSIDHFRAMNVEEIEEFVKIGKKPENLNLRLKRFGVIYKDSKIFYLYGEDIDKYIKEHIEEEKIKDIERFHGQAACLGRVVGNAKIVNKVEDMAKVNKGDILVSIQTMPDLVPAMEKAAGFVTDTGGITCHAAIVAREMNKPCITGTKIATKIIKDGDLIEINAQHGTVRILKRFNNK